ncbi:PIN domain nuclease [Rhodococcus sp. IEGM 1408]|uniref:PIN domain nuclease n=1 Tax=Rhodococcus sp. IEGM 1408 TaxID=3082220 RepID=UPI00295583F0|nr:PIN domain nuclease [Rhodococcus sp. IEGM 1408]MDV8001687.1 PIN domain nuclease [Rhodococcus sp. IEGM 1408]
MTRPTEQPRHRGGGRRRSPHRGPGPPGGKLQLPGGFSDAVLAAGLVELTVSAAHVAAVDTTALPHRDPFDHMLVAQARVERLQFVTADAAILPAGLPFVIDARE